MEEYFEECLVCGLQRPTVTVTIPSYLDVCRDAVAYWASLGVSDILVGYDGPGDLSVDDLVGDGLPGEVTVDLVQGEDRLGVARMRGLLYQAVPAGRLIFSVDTGTRIGSGCLCGFLGKVPVQRVLLNGGMIGGRVSGYDAGGMTFKADMELDYLRGHVVGHMQPVPSIPGFFQVFRKDDVSMRVCPALMQWPSYWGYEDIYCSLATWRRDALGAWIDHDVEVEHDFKEKMEYYPGSAHDLVAAKLMVATLFAQGGRQRAIIDGVAGASGLSHGEICEIWEEVLSRGERLRGQVDVRTFVPALGDDVDSVGVGPMRTFPRQV